MGSSLPSSVCCHLPHCMGPFRSLFWGERLRNIAFGPWLIEHVSQTDGFPNWILSVGPLCNGNLSFHGLLSVVGNVHPAPYCLLVHCMV